MLICWQQASKCSSMTAPNRPASNLTMLTWSACRCVSWSVSVRSSMAASNSSCVHVQPGGGASIEVESHVDGQVRIDKLIGQLIEGKDQVGADDEQQSTLLVHRHYAAARARCICAELRAFASWQNKHGG